MLKKLHSAILNLKPKKMTFTAKKKGYATQSLTKLGSRLSHKHLKRAVISRQEILSKAQEHRRSNPEKISLIQKEFVNVSNQTLH